MGYKLFLYFNRGPPACSVVIPLLHRNFTCIHRLPPVQTVVRPARTGAMSALLRDTPWLNRKSPYLHRGHNSCRFATVSPGGLTVEIRLMPEERWCPGKSRRCFAPRCVPVSPSCFKDFETTGTTSRWTPVQHAVSRFNAVLPGVATVWSRWAPVSTP